MQGPWLPQGTSYHHMPEKVVARRLIRSGWLQNAANFTSETWYGFEDGEDTLAVALDLEDAYN